MKRIFLLVLGVLALRAQNADAQVFLKPESFKAHAVRVQNLKIETRLIGPFALTKVSLACLPETGNRNIAAQFIAAKPQDATVIAFSFESGANYYDARVVKSGEVAPRNVAEPKLKPPGNDRILRGLNEKNSFRARLYPVSAWDGLKVSWTYLQVLDAPGNRTTYRLPLTQLTGATMRLDALEVAVEVAGENVARVGNDYNLPVKTGSGAFSLALSQKNYRVMRDLDVNVVFNAAPLRATLLTASNEKNDGGFYALALNASRDLNAPAVSHSGFTGEQKMLSSRSVRAGQKILECGVFKGALQSTAVQVQSEGATFEAVNVKAVAEPAARSTWALQKIAALAGSAKPDRAALIKISQEYSVPIRETMWLASSEDDWRFYRRALVSSQLDPLVREWWIHFADGKEKSARSLRLKKVIGQISRTNGLNAEDEIYVRLGSALNYAESKAWSYEGKPRTRDEKRTARLRRRTQEYFAKIKVRKEVDEYAYGSENATYFATRNELYELRTKIMGEYRKPQPDYGKLTEWEHRFSQLYGSMDRDPRLALWRARITSLNLDAQQSAAQKSGDKTELAAIEKARIANSRNAYFVNNIGDPPIYVSASADARQVIAIMPDGKIKALEYNAAQKRWEGNYDVPVAMKDGDYSIRIVIVNANGSRKGYAMNFRVDTTPPTGKGEVLVARNPATETENPLRLEIEHGGDVARVTALLPWGEKVSLLPSTAHKNRFFALVRAPREYSSGKAIKMIYILVDRAHNMTTIEAESAAEKTP